MNGPTEIKRAKGGRLGIQRLTAVIYDDRLTSQG